MSRSGLAVALRLARIDQRRALALLGAARARSAALEDQLAALDALRARARAGMALGAGQSVAAEVLQQHCMQLAGAELLARSASARLTSARSAEESARAALAQRRLRVRVVANALERRGRRARLHARRREAQRIDEAVRALRARAEAGDALA
jgi:flagellar export protein FliJ